ncbi:hypothetical protein [Arthrobacter sp. AL12]|uniref:hypothetical protein n=1 Tax=Arthrobacter sp. AL12 TaxID=3042241 RepID=UPI00249A7B96|nr:hypothetical protein [Arthrobacter sp. AL12]MDI3213409.1 hypothetical protein [Arthrobacter sp. AL12]
MKKKTATQPEPWAPTRQAAPAPACRPDGTFRFSDRFIKMATTVLVSLLAAVLGGEAIRAGGGFIGFFLILGMLAAVAGGTELGQEMLGRTWTPWAFWGGTALMALAVGSFWIVGWIARVPMWLQAPVLGSPRVVVRGSSENPADIVRPNELDERAPVRYLPQRRPSHDGALRDSGLLTVGTVDSIYPFDR